MKKECIALGLLLTILALVLINIRCINNLTGALIARVESATACAESGDWEGAERQVKALADTWNANDSYTHIILRHTEIDLTTDAIYEFTEKIYEQNFAAILATGQMTIYHLNSLATMEQIRFGSIF